MILFSVVLFYFRASGIEKNLSNILYYDFKGYEEGIKPERYFSTTQSKLNATVPQVTAIDNRTDLGGITTERQKVNDGGDILKLNENKDGTNPPKQTDDVVMTNCSVNIPESKTQSAEPDDKLCSMISIPDYEELTPKELLKYDNRTTVRYFRDLLFVHHGVLSLVFRKSLKEPLFIRVWMFVFSLSMQFVFNALMYTDDVIDQRQANQKNVPIYYL
jgi:hypothetical protein